jgi:hypothetical protein
VIGWIWPDRRAAHINDLIENDLIERGYVEIRPWDIP